MSSKVWSLETDETYWQQLEDDHHVTNSFISLAPRIETPPSWSKRSLAGWKYAVKDNIDVADLPTTCGSRFFRHVPDRNPPLIRALSESGAVCVGKTNLGEFALDATNQNPHFGAVSNPADLSRISGGSSGGSAAAVAAGLVDFALGTDSGGSVRIPAALCGTYGFRPTGASLSTDGIVGAAPSIDSYGILANSIEEISAVMAEAPDWKTNPRPTALTRDIRVGYLQNQSLGPVQPEVWQCYNEALDSLRRARWDLKGISLDGLTIAPYACAIIAYCEVALHHAEMITIHEDDYGEAVWPLIQLGRSFRAVDYIAAQRARVVLAKRYLAQTSELDCILTPTVPFTAPKQGEVPFIPGDDGGLALFAFIRFTCLANLIDVPSVSVPIGSAANGLPVGLQIMGRIRSDWELLGLASSLGESLNAPSPG